MTRYFRLLLTLIIPILLGAITFLWCFKFFTTPANLDDSEIRLVEVPRNGSFRALCKNLEEQGVIRHWRILDILSRLRSEDTKIKAGEYELMPSMSPQEILAKLSSGEVFKRVLVVKEGFNIWDIAEALEAAGILDQKEFLDAAQNKNLLYKAAIRSSSFEGYLFPSTYHFSRADSVDRIIWTMMEEGEKHWTPAFIEMAAKLNLSRHEVLTLASIIEKESGNIEEQPIISSVFHNRMESLMKLQADPTVIYGLKKFGKPLTKKDLESPTPYNTYVNFGLPPGPISNPGLSSIKATLYPAESKNLFFVADGKGGHIFFQISGGA